MNSKIGIMDIGSNSIRLVIYEITETGAYRIVQECKEAARLSEKVGTNGTYGAGSDSKHRSITAPIYNGMPYARGCSYACSSDSRYP